MSSRTDSAWPPLSADSNTIMAWCLAYDRPTQFYTQRLGLHHKEAFPLERNPVSEQGSPSQNNFTTEKTKKGKPTFEGEVASQCKCLHKMIMEAVQRIADRYHTKEELETAVKLQHDLSISETTRPLLVHVGPIIWNKSEPYQTKIIPSQYPRHLKFQNENDLQTIMLYVYCWIIGRVARAQANRRSSSRRLPRSKRTTLEISLSSSEEGDQDDFDTSGNSDKCTAYVFDNGQSGTNRYGRRINNPLVPVAPMLPMVSNKTTSATLPGVNQPGAEESSKTMASGHRGNALIDGDDSGTFQPDRPTHRTGIKRRGHSTIDAPLSKVAKAKHASPTPALITRRKARVLDTEEAAGTTSYPSPPLLQLNELEEASNGRNFPNIRPGCPSDRNKATVTRDTGDPNSEDMAPNQHSKFTSLPPVKEHGSITVTAPTDAASDNEDGDNDSVQGLEVPGAEAMHVCYDNEYDRERLATELFDVLFGKLQKLDIVVVESTLDLLESIYEMNRLRPTNLSMANLGRYRDSFDQWLKCFRLVIQYYKDTKFTGNLSERSAFKMTLPGNLAKSMTQILLRGRWALSKLRRESNINNNDFAKQVASVLFQIASWGDDVHLQEVEEITIDFTEELLAWFK
ncbi:hypothetical protein HBH64_034400 [Parastagonospora nodorum]|nr:hypothetical protein HBH49_068240 [Parastagonospora nodorum]KAH4108751.1 hypothetical protein HBH46_036850 [Parastagonospora nodorum]KAH4130894.1 hypothetical protein HBH47_016420 [Parastagonospora nodorum]KAH4308008.1 hypothetical protein HBI01_044430 [Parastagonospora nodorum]KAH4314000.1 hypothetical protein HBI02_071910 [Parastagonospora nodorum]